MSIMHKLFGHKFRPRYDEPGLTTEQRNDWNYFAETVGREGMFFDDGKTLRAFKSKNYVYDICERCGEIRVR